MAPVLDLAGVLDPAFVVKFHSLTRPGKWGCIEWAGARAKGYGEVQCAGRRWLAHRAAWVQHHGISVPGELVVDHLCCNKGCVNAEHLEAVTDSENSWRITHGVAGWISVGKPQPWGRRRVRADLAMNFTATGRLRKVPA